MFKSLSLKVLKVPIATSKANYSPPSVNVTQISVFCATVQFCNVFYTTFLLPHSPCSHYLAQMYMQHVKVFSSSCVYWNALRICNIVNFQCIWRNVLWQGRMGTIKRFYEIHSKIGKFYKTHRIHVTFMWILQTVII